MAQTQNGIMAHVIECQVAGCGYTTNVVGDMTRHRHDRHQVPSRYPKHVDDSPAFEVPDHMAHAYRDGKFRPSEY